MLPLGRKSNKEDQQDEDDSGEQDAWTTIDKTVRKVDEDKVKDCTDDIDTLLVFAGLYSAVLTAFLIESYKNLQPDTKEDLLRQIAGQTANYSFSGGYLNSTFTPSQLPSFQAALSDIRVNVCWFASLILSLSTASYGILVKQWLREYLAIDRTSAQERIRVRHFRARGLEEWKLYDIAAILPVILQISLTLFFVGLCFFTSAVHPSIGRTSLFLVGGWAVVFFFAIIAPLVSARCPYKTTFLKSAFIHLRPCVRSIVPHTRSMAVNLALSLRRHIVASFNAISHTTHTISSTIGSQALHMVQRDQDTRRVSTSVVGGFSPRSAFDTWQSNAGSDQNVDPAPRIDPFEDVLYLGFVAKLSEYVVEEDTSIQEEIEMRSNDSNDLAIFRNVDSTFLDDGLLARMREALKRRSPPPRQLFDFAVSVLQHRLAIPLHEIDVDAANSIPWPWALSHTARMSLINIVADSLLLEKTSIPQWLHSTPGSSLQWTKDAIRLMFTLSLPQTSMPKTATSVFERLLQDTTGEFHSGWAMLSWQIRSAAEYTSNRHDTNWLTHRVFTCIADALKILDAEYASWVLQCIVHRCYVDFYEYIPRQANTYHRLLTQMSRNDESVARIAPETIVVLVEVAALILYTLTADDSSNQQRATAFSESITLLLDFVLKAIPVIEKDLPDADLKEPRIPGGIGLDKLLTGLFTTPRLVYPFLEFLSTRSDFLSTSGARSFLSALRSQELSPPTEASVLSACGDYFSDRVNSEAYSDLISLLRLCHLVYIFSTSADGEVLEGWHKMFSAALACIRKVCSHLEVPSCPDKLRHTDACKAVHEKLLELQLDDNHTIRTGKHPLSEDEMYLRWSTQFDVKKSQVPDELIDLYHRMICNENAADEEGHKFWRIRRLEDMEAEVGSSVDEADASASASDVMTEVQYSQFNRSETLKPTRVPSPQLYSNDVEDIEDESPAVPTTVLVHLAPDTLATTSSGSPALLLTPSPSSHIDDPDYIPSSHLSTVALPSMQVASVSLEHTAAFSPIPQASVLDDVHPEQVNINSKTKLGQLVETRPIGPAIASSPQSHDTVPEDVNDDHSLLIDPESEPIMSPQVILAREPAIASPAQLHIWNLNGVYGGYPADSPIYQGQLGDGIPLMTTFDPQLQARDTDYVNDKQPASSNVEPERVASTTPKRTTASPPQLHTDDPEDVYGEHPEAGSSEHISKAENVRGADA